MREIIALLLSKSIKLSKEEIAALLEVPLHSELGDYAFPCFSLAKEFKKNPVEIAKDIAGKIKSNELEKIEARGPYVNFFINRKNLAEETLNKIIKEKGEYGSSEIGKGKKMMVEFPSPNTNKPLHLGHLRNISLGESISRILGSQGNKVIRANLNNDRGVHICKSMLAYEKWGKDKTPESEKIKSDHIIGDYYVMFSKAAKENPQLEEEAQEMLKKWEAGDKKTILLWKKMNKWALDGFKETYKVLGIKHDKEYYESKIYKEGKELIQQGLDKSIFRKNAEGAIIADLTKENLGEKVVLRADGTSIYITQDLYLAVLKDKEFKLDGSIYVVANEQDYHFKVLFTILKKFGFGFTKNLHHLSYGMVELPEGRMKSREGTVVDADNLISETKDLAKDEIKKRDPETKEKDAEDRSLKIALGAIKYMLLKIDPVKNMTFNPKEAISFEGDTGPYLLYSYARAKSILRKAKYKRGKVKVGNLDDEEKSIVNELARFNKVVKNSYENLSPNVVANYAYQLSQKFNEFYHRNKVIGSENEQFRLCLVDCFSIVLKNALFLLGINVLEKM